MSKKKAPMSKGRRIFYLVCALLTTIVGSLAKMVYGTYQSPVEAQIAAQQVADSNTAWALHQAMSNNFVQTTLSLTTLAIVVAFLSPIVIDLIKNPRK